MHVTFFSFAIAIIWFNLAILICTIIGGRSKFLYKYGITALYILIWTCLFRLFCSFELPYTAELLSYDILPKLIDFTQHKIIDIKDYSVTVWQALKVVWIVGGVLVLVKNLIDHLLLTKRAKACSLEDTSYLQALFDGISPSRYSKKIKFIQSPYITVPMTTHFFTPRIFLPDYDYTDEELCIILKHELSHIKNRDSWTNLFILVLKSIFWWNFIFIFFEKMLKQVLELRADYNVVGKEDEINKLSYLKSMIKLYEQNDRNYHTSDLTLGFSKIISKNFINQRYDMVLNYKDVTKTPKHYIKHMIILLLITSTIFFSSFTFVIQPYCEPDTTSENIFGVDFLDENIHDIKPVTDGDSILIYVDGKPYFKCTVEEYNKYFVEYYNK